MTSIIETSNMSLDRIVDEIIMDNIYMQTQGYDVAIPYIRGNPGCGKTAVLFEACQRFGLNMYHCRFSTLPIEDISGIPQIVELSEAAAKLSNLPGKIYGTNWTMPELVSDIYEVAANGKPTLVFLDDFHLCDSSHTAYGFDLFSDRKLRQYIMPPNVAFTLAGNSSTKSGAKKLLAAVANRVMFLETYMDFKKWKQNYAIPHRVNSKVLSFLSRASNMKYCYDDEIMSEAWGSFRSWSRLANLIGFKEANLAKGEQIPRDTLYTSAIGSVGAEGATAFVTYYYLFADIDTDAIFNKDAEIVIPKEMDKLYIYCMACLSELYVGFYESFTNNNTKFPIDKYYNKIAEIILEVSKNSTDMALISMRDIIDNSKYIGKNTRLATKIWSIISKTDPVKYKDLAGRLGEMTS